MNQRTTIRRDYDDELNRHGFAAMSAIAMSFGDIGFDLAATLPHHHICLWHTHETHINWNKAHN
jgi:hypothetical protein